MATGAIPTRVRATLFDGRTFEAVGLYMAPADRRAIAQRWPEYEDYVAAQVAGQMQVAGGQPGPVPVPREEWIMFALWRLLRRAGCDVGEYEVFAEDLASYELEAMPEDPTDAGAAGAPGATSGSSLPSPASSASPPVSS